jgi:hypothetical protein
VARDRFAGAVKDLRSISMMKPPESEKFGTTTRAPLRLPDRYLGTGAQAEGGFNDQLAIFLFPFRRAGDRFDMRQRLVRAALIFPCDPARTWAHWILFKLYDRRFLTQTERSF